MLKIASFFVEGKDHGLIVTDNPKPRFSFSLASDKEGTELREAKIRFEDGYELSLPSELGCDYAGPALKPFTRYKATLIAKDNHDEEALGAYLAKIRANIR